MLLIQFLVYGMILSMFIFELSLSLLNFSYRNQPIPEVVNDVYEDDTYLKYQSYSMMHFKYNMIFNSIDLVLILVLLLSGFFLFINHIINRLIDHQLIAILVFLFIFFLIQFIFNVVYSYIRTFKIEQKFGFNQSTIKTFVLDKVKSLIFSIILGGGLLYGLLGIYQNTGWQFIFYAWLFMSVIMVVVNLIYTSVIVPVFNKLRPLEEGSLKSSIESFAHSVGYQVNRISIMDASKRSSKLNAFFSGFGKSKRIVLYDTLVDKMSEDQVVAVLAHEIGHNKYKHIIFNLFQTLLVLSLYIVLLFVFLREPMFSKAFGFDSIHLGFNLLLYMFLISPIITVISILTSSVSRKFEYQADDFVKVNGYGEHLVEALKVLSRENFANLTPHPLYVKLFYSHPPVADRIIALRK